MILPKLYRVVDVTFNSLRFNGMCEVDEIVTRKARRVLCDDGWEWQIIEGCSSFINDTDRELINEPDYIEFIALGEKK